MSIKIIGNHLSPAEGEVVVRTYHCTNLSPIFAAFGLKTDGYLTVTNKRVIYFAEGSSVYGAAGSSKLYNELPIADVATISLKKGTRFSFLRLLFGIFIGQIPAGIVTLIFSGVVSILRGAGGDTNPYLLRFGVFLQLTAAVLLIYRSLSISRESIVRLMLAASSLSLVLSVPVLALAHGGALQSFHSAYQSAMAILSLPLGCYWLWCLYWFIRRQYLILSIASRSGLLSPINIVGKSFWSRRETTANLAAWMSPGIDADAMFKELGALVTDVQTLGDHGITKWLQPDPACAAENAKNIQQNVVFQNMAMRFAVAAIVIIGLFISVESMRYASEAKKMLALQMQSELASAKSSVVNDASIKEWVPSLLAAANQEAAAGDNAFERNKYNDAMAHWAAAINTYKNIPNISNSLKKASTLQAQYKKAEGEAYLKETASERLKSAFLMRSFSALIDQHPSPNSPWKKVKQNATEARGLDELENWNQIGMAWKQAGYNLPQATGLMHADIWVKLAEDAIKKNNASGATNCAENALQEVPGYSDAIQRKDLAMNMIEYDQWLGGDIESGVGGAQFVGEEWTTIKSIVENARDLANKNEWVKSNDEWKNALGKMPSMVLAWRMEIMELAARKGNWTTVSKLAGKILQDRPEQLRASELKKKADGIISARNEELKYQQAMAKALALEVERDQIKIGDMTDFIAHMDRYGEEDWAQIKEAISKAEGFRLNEQGVECSNEWAKACAQFPSAVHRMRAEIWLEQADQAAKNGNWAKVLIYAENALKEKPELARAKQLRDQADTKSK